MKQTPLNDLRVAAIARKHGMHYALTIAQEARLAGLSYALGYALAQQETTTARNVFGHDDVRNPAPKGAPVTKARYMAYKAARKAGLGMQGVGPLQLTWWETQDRADALGGCWRPRFNFRVGFGTLAALIKAFGYKDGIRRYNGSGPAAIEYSFAVRAKRDNWFRRLNPK